VLHAPSSLGALAVGPDLDGPGRLAAAARKVVDFAGLSAVAASPESGGFTPERLAAMASAELLKAAGVINPAYAGWDTQSEEILIAQGQASGAAGRMFERFFLPQLPDLRQRLDTRDNLGRRTDRPAAAGRWRTHRQAVLRPHLDAGAFPAGTGAADRYRADGRSPAVRPSTARPWSNCSSSTDSSA
jgi:hypothetical protein